MTARSFTNPVWRSDTLCSKQWCRRRGNRAVAILEWKKWGGHCKAKEKVGGAT